MSPESFKRKLTAILSADVKGYSRLMGEDEAETVKTLTAYRKIMGELIQQHRGRLVDSPGDNILAEFGSVVDAVQCAVAAQNEFKARNAELSENRRMLFRIGINLGDVIEEEGRIYGDGVNIAARLEALAEPGGICISKTAFDHIESKLPLGYKFLGEQTVKNIAKPVGAYKVLMEPRVFPAEEIKKAKEVPFWKHKPVLAGVVAVLIVILGVAVWNFYWRAPKIEPASKDKMALPLPDKPSIAVLAFTNLSGDPKDDLFGDGLVEGIIDGLSKSEQIFVIARNSTFTYKGKPVKVKQVAEEMGVRYVIEGSVQREGKRVRITVQLIDALTGRHLFSERYDRDLKGILSLQDEITMKVLEAVQVKLTKGESARIQGKGTKNLDAYLKVLQAIEVKAITQSRERVERSRQLLEEAIALDPEYSSAYSGLSTVHTALVVIGASESPRESLQRAVELGKKAIALDDANPSGHISLVFPYIYLREFDKAISEAEMAVSLSPNSAAAYWALGTALSFSGRPREAIPLLQKSFRLSPIPVHSQVLGNLASSYAMLGQYEEAIATYKKVLQIYGPDHLMAHVGLAVSYAQMGHENEARAESAEVLRIDPKFSWERWIKGLPSDKSRKDRLTEALNRAGLSDKPSLSLPDKPSIAVLPFVNMSEDKSQEFFSDGLTEEIITALSKAPKLFVIASNSSFVYKGKPVNIQQVSRELGVKYVLEGSVRRSGDQLRITAQLIDATTGNHLWAERYDREMKEIFAVQDDITKNIVTALQVQLTEGEQARIYAKGTKKLEAYLKIMEGWWYQQQSTKDGIFRAQKLAEEAIALDPNYAFAYYLLGATHYTFAWSGLSKNPQESLALGVELNRKAITLDNSLGISYGGLGYALVMLGQYDQAIAAGERAFSLEPNSAGVLHNYASILMFAGRNEEAIPLFKEALRLNPRPPNTYYRHYGNALANLGRYDEAIALQKTAIEQEPNDIFAYMVLASVCSMAGREAEARSAAQQVLRLNPKFSVAQVDKVRPDKDRAVAKRWCDTLRQAGLPD